MISTGTDVKPIECVFFLRNVKSESKAEPSSLPGSNSASPFSME